MASVEEGSEGSSLEDQQVKLNTRSDTTAIEPAITLQGIYQGDAKERPPENSDSSETRPLRKTLSVDRVESSSSTFRNAISPKQYGSLTQALRPIASMVSLTNSSVAAPDTPLSNSNSNNPDSGNIGTKTKKSRSSRAPPDTRYQARYNSLTNTIIIQESIIAHQRFHMSKLRDVLAHQTCERTQQSHNELEFKYKAVLKENEQLKNEQDILTE